MPKPPKRGRGLPSGAGSAPERAGPFASRLIEEYGLTPAELRVALGVAEGLSYREIAKQLGVSYHTVHTHIKAIHEKTGVKTNGRLLALMGQLKQDDK